jgi:hypothetical protein
LRALACRRGHPSRQYRRLCPRLGKLRPVSLFSPKFLVIILTLRAICNDVLCLELNPNQSSRTSLRSHTLSKTVFEVSFQVVYKLFHRGYWVDSVRAVPHPSPVRG